MKEIIFFPPRGHGIESCNLIGSSRGPDFRISAHGHGNALRVFVFDLQFPFFDTESVYMKKLVSRDNSLRKRIQIKIFPFETFRL